MLLFSIITAWLLSKLGFYDLFYSLLLEVFGIRTHLIWYYLMFMILGLLV